MKIQYVFAIHLMRWLTNFYDCSNEQLQQQLESTLLNPDCHSWWISKMQSGCEDTIEERYAIKFCFKLGKTATETSLSQTIWPRWASRQILTVPIVQTLLPVTFGYSLCSNAVIMRQLRRWKRLWLPWGLPEVVVTVQKVHCNRRRLLRRGPECHVCTINKSAHTKKVWKLI